MQNVVILLLLPLPLLLLLHVKVVLIFLKQTVVELGSVIVQMTNVKDLWVQSAISNVILETKLERWKLYVKLIGAIMYGQD